MKQHRQIGVDYRTLSITNAMLKSAICLNCSTLKFILIPLILSVIILTILYEERLGGLFKSSTAFLSTNKYGGLSHYDENALASLPDKVHKRRKSQEFTHNKHNRKSSDKPRFVYRLDVHGGVDVYSESKLTGTEIVKAKEYLAYTKRLPNTRLTMTRKLPNAIVIGVKKGGTRALLRILKIHPMIQTAGEEVHFFDRAFDNGFEWYQQQMPLSFTDQITIEKSPSYFVTERVPGKVSQMSNNIKLLVIVRDPTERAISDYTQSVAKGSARESFETLAINTSDDSVNTRWGSVKIGLYYIYLKRWLKYFSLDQIHFVSGEKLVQNPAEELRAVERFLNLEPFINKDHFYFNKTKGFPCFVKPVKQECLGETKGRQHVVVRDDVKEKLQAFYRPYNEKLYKWVNRDFGWP